MAKHPYLMNCPYCGYPFNMWVKQHPECEKKKQDFQHYLIDYIEEKFLSGTFKISALSEKFLEAEKYLTSEDMSTALQVGIEFAIDKMLEDDEIDDQEMALWNKYVDEWEKVLPSATSKILCPDGANKLIYGQILNFLRNKGLEAARGLGFECMRPNSQIMISKEEEFIFKSNLLWGGAALDVKTRYAGHSTGASYQLTKNTRIRHSQHRGQTIKYDQWNKIGFGEIAITNKHLYFLGTSDSRDLKERLSSISSVETLDKGLILNTNLKTRPAIMINTSTVTESWMVGNILTMAQSL